MNGWRIVGLLLLVIGAAATTGWTLLITIAYALVGVLVVGLIWSRTALAWLEVRRDVPAERVQVGDVLVERFTVRNRGWLPKLWVALLDGSTLPGHEPGRVVDLPPRSERGWNTRTLCTRRGAYTLGPLELRGSDPFGCFAARRRLPGTRHVLVLPATHPLPDFHLPSRDLPGGTRTRAAGALSAAQAASVRDYVPGDPVSRVHWRSTARSGRLMVKEVEHEPSADVWLALDLHRAVQRGAGADSTEEQAVTVAASVARRFLDAGRSVGLAMHGERHVLLQPERGDRQLDRILDALAVARAEGEVPFAELLRADALRPDRNATLVAITPSVDASWPEALQLVLAGRGARGAAILIEPSTFGGRESSIFAVGQLAAAGMPTYVVKRGSALHEVLRGE